MRFLVVTSARRLVLADRLEASLMQAHPDAEVLRLWCDARLTGVPGRAVVLPQRVDFGGLRWADLVLALGERDAGWAALGWLLADTGPLAGAAEPLVVLEDTFEAFGPLHSLVVTGDKPAARARHVDAGAGAWGGFNPGLLVAPASGWWLPWWRARVADALAAGAPDRSASTAPASTLPSPGWAPLSGPWWQLPVDVHTVTDPAVCLSAATAGEIELDEHGRLVDGRVPALVDFAGLDPERPWRFVPPAGEAETYLSSSAGLAQLCRQRADRLSDAGWAADGPEEPPVLVGVPVTAALRAWYRGLLAERAPGDLPPNPLVAGEVGAFLELLRAPGEVAGAAVDRLSDLVVAGRDDLRRAFPHPRWRDRRSLRRWIWSHGLREGDTALVTLPDPPRPAAPPRRSGGRLPFGVNLVGYMDADLGLGVAARRLQRSLEQAGVPCRSVSYDRTASHLRRTASGELTQPYHFNLMVITPDQLPLFVEDVGEGFLDGHHNIGLWYWESDVLAPSQMEAFSLVDEVWVATGYLREAFASAGRVPVHVVPPALVFDQPDPAAVDRRRLGLDDRFTFLFSFDFLSVAERKNPLGLAEAYRRAFPDPDRAAARLVLKSINGHVFPDEREHLVASVADRPDIDVWDRLLPATDRLALVAASDCYVSLHRAEGLGLTMAEAMAVGTPVIATGYSGNLDFMDGSSALLVPAQVVEVGPDRYYPAHGHWAEPDLDVAAQLMRRVHDDTGLRTRLAAAGRDALSRFSHEAAGAAARAALVEAWRSSTGPAAGSART